jgi:hypothetical protein
MLQRLAFKAEGAVRIIGIMWTAPSEGGGGYLAAAAAAPSEGAAAGSLLG